MDKKMNEVNKSLWNAATTGNLAQVEKSLSLGANINTMHQHWTSSMTKMTVLGLTAYNGHFSIVEHLIKTGANPFIPFNGTTPKQLALKGGHQAIAEYLEGVMKSAIQLNKIGQRGYTVLTYCIRYNFQKRAKELVRLGADITKEDNHGKTPLMYAISQNCAEMVQFFVENGASCNFFSSFNYALSLRANAMLKIMIDLNGTLMDCILPGGWTPLTKALKDYNIEVAKYLLQNGADPSKTDERGTSPLEAALDANSIEFVELLLAKGVKIPRELRKKTIHRVISGNCLERYRFLLKHNWNIDQKCLFNNTPLFYHAEQGHVACVMWLIENGADVNLAKKQVEVLREQSEDFDCFMKMRDRLNVNK